MPRLTTFPRASRKVAIASLICAWPAGRLSRLDFIWLIRLRIRLISACDGMASATAQSSAARDAVVVEVLGVLSNCPASDAGPTML